MYCEREDAILWQKVGCRWRRIGCKRTGFVLIILKGAVRSLIFTTHIRCYSKCFAKFANISIFSLTGMKLLRIATICLLCMLTLGACSDDNEDMSRIKVRVAIRVDSHVPPSVTVFGHQINLSNDNWLITLENFRTYEEKISVPTSVLRTVPAGPLPTSSPELEGIFSVQTEQGKSVFTLETETEGTTYLFIIY